MDQLMEACYYIAANYELTYWLLQDWLKPTIDLQPLFDHFISGCSVRVTDTGVVEVIRH